MRILQLSNRVPYPPNDGGAIAILNMVYGFVGQGCYVKLLALNTRKHYVSISELPAALKEKAHLEAVSINTAVKPLPAIANLLFSRDSYNIVRFYSKDFEGKLIEVLQKEKFDIVQLEGLHISIYMDTIRKYHSGRISLRAHNVEHFIWERLAESEKPGFKKSYLKVLAARMKKYELEVLNKFDSIVAITHRDAETFRKLGCRVPIHVSPAGLSVKDYKISRNSQQKGSLFHLGALDWLPNQQAIQWFLDDVWPAVVEKHPAAQFYIAGRNLPAWIEKLRLQNVVIEGEVKSAADFINSKELMVVPLLSGSGMRIKIIEGMALGKCIISTSIGAEGIECVNDENILIADTARQFAEVIHRCLSEQGLPERIGRNARQLAESAYDNDKIMKKLLGFYDGLISQ